MACFLAIHKHMSYLYRSFPAERSGGCTPIFCFDRYKVHLFNTSSSLFNLFSLVLIRMASRRSDRFLRTTNRLPFIRIVLTTLKAVVIEMVDFMMVFCSSVASYDRGDIQGQGRI